MPGAAATIGSGAAEEASTEAAQAAAAEVEHRSLAQEEVLPPAVEMPGAAATIGSGAAEEASTEAAQAAAAEGSVGDTYSHSPPESQHPAASTMPPGGTADSILPQAALAL
eukprot:TRINITY_DN31083_c0_g2_i2.p3 TRINITY_DN31083_c0_g2~~TRINITY_DN31083_c0_g2_i2.p3  ORF type:complete len:124 (-),score=44.04 TRINITY_DN31083_c0_g2_i2:97-429(-)